MMRQIREASENETMNIALGTAKESSDNTTVTPMVCVYGYGPTKNPFYEEAQTVKADSNGALLILGAPVSRGQKLLLINGSGRNPVEAQIINTRTLGTQMFEVEVAFPGPRPDFWQPLRGGAKKTKAAEKRRFPRMNLPRGMSIAWQATRQHDISRVASLSLGGLFIETAEPAPMGDTLQVQFDIPDGAVRAKAVVRRSIKGKGMGIEFTELPAAARSGLIKLLQSCSGMFPLSDKQQPKPQPGGSVPYPQS